jgi:monoterpene epsilon-lactone hydrolase
VTASEEPGMFHVFPILMPWAEASRRVFHAVGEFVHSRLGDQPPASAPVARDGAP